jgi:hypothetical protein
MYVLLQQSTGLEQTYDEVCSMFTLCFVERKDALKLAHCGMAFLYSHLHKQQLPAISERTVLFYSLGLVALNSLHS